MGFLREAAAIDVAVLIDIELRAIFLVAVQQRDQNRPIAEQYHLLDNKPIRAGELLDVLVRIKIFSVQERRDLSARQGLLRVRDVLCGQAAGWGLAQP